MSIILSAHLSCQFFLAISQPDGTYCKGFRGVLDAYNKITPRVRMAGPTNFAPLIKEAIRIVKKTGQVTFPILLSYKLELFFSIISL